MKAKSLALLSLAGMLLTSVSVYSLTPPREAASPAVADLGGAGDEALFGGTGATADAATFTAGETLMIEGRVGHPRIARTARGETFVMLEVKGSDTASARVSAPVNLSLVIDRSGSMRGSRLRNAINAAIAAVDHLHEGDVVSVLAFDTRSSLVVPPVAIGPGVRERIAADVRAIALGGDTCISCGIEDSLVELERAAAGKVNRMIVLSDGEATAGIRDVQGFRLLAQRARERGATITTIGVDVDYNERILSAIAQEGNGRHYFVENDAALARVFEAEAESLTSTIASNAEARIDLGPGVELEQVMGRSFRREGSSVVVPLGTFDRGEVKTVLMKVALPAGSPGAVPLAGVRLGFRDLLKGAAAGCEGRLAVEVVESTADASQLDAVGAGRVQRNETAEVLQNATSLFAQGRAAEARGRLDAHSRSLREASEVARRPAPATKAKDVGADFDKQLAAIDEAQEGFATPPPAAGATAGAAPPPAARPRKVAGQRSVEKSGALLK